MSRAAVIAENVTWLLSRLIFTLIVDLALFGGYNVYQWYQSTEPYKLDVTQLDNVTIGQLQKELAGEVKFRNGK